MRCAPNIVDIATRLERFSFTRVTTKANDTCISSATFSNNASLSHYQPEKGTGVATVHGTPPRQQLCNGLWQLPTKVCSAHKLGLLSTWFETYMVSLKIGDQTGVSFSLFLWYKVHVWSLKNKVLKAKHCCCHYWTEEASIAQIYCINWCILQHCAYY